LTPMPHPHPTVRHATTDFRKLARALPWHRAPKSASAAPAYPHTGGERRQRRQDRRLSLHDLGRRLGPGGPARTVELGESLDLPRSRGPLDREAIGLKPCRIGFTFHGPDLHRLGARLPETAKRQEISVQCQARLFGELAPCRRQPILARFAFSL